MTGKMPTKEAVEAYLQSLPGKRGIDIPEDQYDKMFTVANGITQQVWGGYPLPHQMQDLWDAGATTPERIHAMFGALPHPLAPSVSVDDYQQYSQAKQLFSKHQK